MPLSPEAIRQLHRAHTAALGEGAKLIREEANRQRIAALEREAKLAGLENMIALCIENAIGQIPKAMTENRRHVTALVIRDRDDMKEERAAIFSRLMEQLGWKWTSCSGEDAGGASTEFYLEFR